MEKRSVRLGVRGQFYSTTAMYASLVFRMTLELEGFARHCDKVATHNVQQRYII